MLQKVISKLNYVFQQLKCAARINLAFSFVLKNIEDASCCYLYAHENNILLEKSELLSTRDDLVHIEKCLLGKMSLSQTSQHKVEIP